MYELREGKKITQALVLYEVLQERNFTLKKIGKKLGISPQGVANYLKELEELGLIEGGAVTKEGVEFLHQTFAGLHKEISGIVSNLNLVLSTDAIADDFIKEGESVYLYMKDGLLHASKRIGEAKGMAYEDAEPGGIVRVHGLSGIVTIKRGKIRIVVLDREGATTMRKVQLPEGDVYAGYGLRAIAFLGSANRNVDIRFCVPEGCVESAVLGLNVVCVLTKEMLYVFLKGLQEAMQKYGEVEYEFID
ncbi:MAG: winged helix-turn-helix transcriptional regulator [Thermoplasmata archaeon]